MSLSDDQKDAQEVSRGVVCVSRKGIYVQELASGVLRPPTPNEFQLVVDMLRRDPLVKFSPYTHTQSEFLREKSREPWRKLLVASRLSFISGSTPYIAT